MSRPVKNVAVHPSFSKLLRVESAINGKSIYEFTKEVGSRSGPGLFSQGLNSEESKDKKNKLRGFRIDI